MRERSEENQRGGKKEGEGAAGSRACRWEEKRGRERKEREMGREWASVGEGKKKEKRENPNREKKKKKEKRKRENWPCVILRVVGRR
jgi:hypothetical protein